MRTVLFMKTVIVNSSKTSRTGFERSRTSRTGFEPSKRPHTAITGRSTIDDRMPVILDPDSYDL